MWKQMKPPLVTSLVTTVNMHGEGNASPKTWWSPVSYAPAEVMLATKPDSHTTLNIKDNGLFVLHLPPQELAEQVLHTAKPLPYGECELDDVGIEYKYLDLEDKKLPYVPTIPWAAFTVIAADENFGDHVTWLGRVLEYGGLGSDCEVNDVLLHKGRNTFVQIGMQYDVEPY